MSELVYNQQTHLTYLRETEAFEQRIWDTYTGMANSKRPPYLDEMLIEFTQMEALLLLDEEKERGFASGNWNRLWEDVWNQEEYAKMEVLNNHQPDGYLKCNRDVCRYMQKNRMSLLVRERFGEHVGHSLLHHSAVSEIW